MPAASSNSSGPKTRVTGSLGFGTRLITCHERTGPNGRLALNHAGWGSRMGGRLAAFWLSGTRSGPGEHEVASPPPAVPCNAGRQLHTAPTGNAGLGRPRAGASVVNAGGTGYGCDAAPPAAHPATNTNTTRNTTTNTKTNRSRASQPGKWMGPVRGAQLQPQDLTRARHQCGCPKPPTQLRFGPRVGSEGWSDAGSTWRGSHATARRKWTCASEPTVLNAGARNDRSHRHRSVTQEQQ